MSRACCLSQFFSCVLIPPFLLQKFASSFLSMCISSCMTRSRGAHSWPSLYMRPGKGKGTFYNLVLSISPSPKNGWSHAEKARTYSPKHSSSLLFPILQYQVESAGCLDLKFLISQQVNNFLYFCTRCTVYVSCTEQGLKWKSRSSLWDRVSSSRSECHDRVFHEQRCDCPSPELCTHTATVWAGSHCSAEIPGITNWMNKCMTGILNIKFLPHKSSKSREKDL